MRISDWSSDVCSSDLFRAIMASDSDHPFKSLLGAIENADDVLAGKKRTSALGILSPIPEVVEIRLSAPRPSLLQVIAHPAMGISDRNMSKVALGPFSFTRTPDGLDRTSTRLNSSH